MSKSTDSIELTRGWPRWPILMASLAILVSLGLLLVDRLFLPDSFQIQDVEIVSDGNNVNKHSVRQAISRRGKQSWFGIDLLEVEREIQQVAWVYESKVRRQWPGFHARRGGCWPTLKVRPPEPLSQRLRKLQRVNHFVQS